MVRSWTSRSCWKHSINGNRLCVTTRGAHGLKLRAKLRQLLHADEIVQAIRLVRTVEGHPRVGPTRYALHVTVQRPADPLAGSRRRQTAIGIDTGARRTATDDTGQTLLPTADTATPALDRGIARKQRRSTGRRRALARRARQRWRTATRRKSAITRGAAILAREHAVIVVEDLDHGAMRSGRRVTQARPQPHPVHGCAGSVRSRTPAQGRRTRKHRPDRAGGIHQPPVPAVRQPHHAPDAHPRPLRHLRLHRRPRSRRPPATSSSRERRSPLTPTTGRPGPWRQWAPPIAGKTPGPGLRVHAPSCGVSPEQAPNAARGSMPRRWNGGGNRPGNHVNARNRATFRVADPAN